MATVPTVRIADDESDSGYRVINETDLLPEHTLWDESSGEYGLTTTVTVEVKHDATDAARDLAEEHGIDLADVDGTGSGGRILKSDVDALIEEG